MIIVNAKLEKFSDSLAAAVASMPEKYAPFAAKLQELVTLLDRDGRSETVVGQVLGYTRPPSLMLFRTGIDSHIVIAADYYDQAETVGRPSSLHYRLQMHRAGSKLTRDFRSDDLDQVARQIRIGLGLKRIR